MELAKQFAISFRKISKQNVDLLISAIDRIETPDEVVTDENIIIEFKQYGLSDLIRNIVGASKISLSALLIAGIFYPGLILFSSLSMAFFMFCAQLAHIKVKNPWVKFIPSLIFLILSLLIAAINMGLL